MMFKYFIWVSHVLVAFVIVNKTKNMSIALLFFSCNWALKITFPLTNLFKYCRNSPKYIKKFCGGHQNKYECWTL